MAVNFSQAELFFQLQMAARYGGCHFQVTKLQNTVLPSRHAVECDRGVKNNKLHNQLLQMLILMLRQWMDMCRMSEDKVVQLGNDIS